jgi:hypothetical protein
MMIIQPQDLVDITTTAVLGRMKYGKGQAIANMVNDVVEENSHIERADIIQDFEEYWYDRMLMRKYNGKYKPASYILPCLFNFMLNYRRKYRSLKADQARHISLPKREEINDDLYQVEGVWKQHNIITDFNKTTCSGVEDTYLLKELITLIEDFTLEEWGEVYLDLFYDKITQSEAADRLGCTRRWIIEKWKEYKVELIAFLIENDYCAEDILEIYK